MRSKFLKEITNISYQDNLTIEELNNILIRTALTKYKEEYTQTGVIDIWSLEDNYHIRVEDLETNENILIWITNNKVFWDYQDLQEEL